MKVFVAIYEHRHGSDVAVYRSYDSALDARDSIARDYWEEEGIDQPMPAERPGQLYFQVMSNRDRGEWFRIEECEVMP